MVACDGEVGWAGAGEPGNVRAQEKAVPSERKGGACGRLVAGVVAMALGWRTGAATKIMRMVGS